VKTLKRLKRLKKVFSLVICLCLLISSSSAFSAFADDGNSGSENTSGGESALSEDSPASIEEPYVGSDTIYDLKNEVDAPILPEPEPPKEEPIVEDELLGDLDFFADIEDQLSMGEYITNEIVIGFYPRKNFPGKEKQYDNEVAKVLKDGLAVVDEKNNIYLVKSDDFLKNPNATMNRYKNSDYIKFIEPNYTMDFGIIPNDPNYKSQSLVLTILNAQKGWDLLSGASAPIIAVVDSGVAAHPDLPPLLPGFSAVAGLSPNNDKLGHGTGVAGTIGCIGNNNIGSAGINWNASIMPVKIDDANGTVTVANVAKGIMWAADNGAKVINLSLGYSADSVALKNAVEYAFDKGCAIFAATGNESKNAVCFPARYTNVMAVGSTTNGSTRVASSNYGPGVNVTAFGGYFTAAPSGGYTNLSGTSFATPQVAALASMVWSLNPKLKNQEVYRLIEQGCKALGSGGFNEQTGYGLIDIEKTLGLAMASNPLNAVDPEAEAAAAAEAAAKAEAEAAAKAAAEAAAAAEKARLEAEAKAKAEAEAKAAAEAAAAAAKAAAEAAAKAAAEEAAKAAAEEAAAKAAAEAAAKAAEEAKAKAEAEAAEKARLEAEAAEKARLELEAALAAQAPPETQQEVRTPPIITLTGFTELTLEYGQAYNEMGFKAFDCKNVNLTGSVNVTNNINIWKAGIYTVNYEVTDSTGLEAHAIRTVTVKPEPVVVIPKTAPKITIIGSNPIILHQTSSTPYKEQSARAIDYDGTDISKLVIISGSVKRATAGTYTLTYSITSPVTGLKSTATRNVRIVAPLEKKDPRTKYGLSGQAKAGAKVTHTGVVSNAVGFMDLHVSSIDKNMTISVELIDTTTKKAVLKDTFTAAGTKQYRIDKSKYELVVAIDKANGNSKYSINLLMPETAATVFFTEDEVPLTYISAPKVAPIGSNPIILHLGGTPYKEQGARAVDFNDEVISERVEVIGEPDTSVAGTYVITYRVVNDLGLVGEATRDVRIIAPNEFGYFDEEEVPLANLPMFGDNIAYVVLRNDSLWGIAKKLYGDPLRWYEIYDMNKDAIGKNPGALSVGQVLVVKPQ